MGGRGHGGVSGTVVLLGKCVCQLYGKEKLMANRFSHKLASDVQGNPVGGRGGGGSGFLMPVCDATERL